MPHWVQQGYEEYAKRMPKECALILKEITAAKRQKNSDLQRLIKDEGERLLAALPPQAYVVALDRQGVQQTTEALADTLSHWMSEGRFAALLIGGPEGLSEECLRRADAVWSLSSMTFPHPLVRILVAEQFYRAWSILQRHPYHR